MSLDFEYRIVDVFSDKPLAGNALCVVLDPVPEPVMQAIAREVNLSETTFPVVTADGEYENRIFTPTLELPFAGHPTLGTAWVLGPGRWMQHTAGADVEVVVDQGGAVMTQPDPTYSPADSADAVQALGLPGAEGAWVAQAAGNRMFLVLTESAIDRLEPDMHAVAAVSRNNSSVTLAVVRRLDDRTLHVRVFVPGAGIPEDPGTGSAAGPIGLLARTHWGTDADVTVRQGAEVGRPCIIEVHAEEGALRVGGRVAMCAKGHFSL
ncbi:MAG: trans-2,3-dihydro-3-hydroxyanthranilate isomerase [Acidimicrobiaceae bacterium]|nr:trans-2,3-dihydro-3-hydroxyanthranilate isomerase [Acidimicrobiaceae bacterium]